MTMKLWTVNESVDEAVDVAGVYVPRVLQKRISHNALFTAQPHTYSCVHTNSNNDL